MTAATKMTESHPADVDLVDVEIFQRQLYSIANEMGLVMIRTSGDPVISEAVDFSTFIADANGEIISFSGYMTWHLGPARQTVRHLIHTYDRSELHPGDAFICNDPHTTGACHPPDVGIVRPIFFADELVAWCWAEAHLLDVGGIAPGGFAPTATESYGEALRFPGIKIVSEGRLINDIVRLIQTNFRIPTRNLNDIRCFIAACNVCDERMQELLARDGTETFRRNNEIGKRLSERAVRTRVATLPDGTTRALDYVEHNGHVNKLYPIDLTVTVDGDRMTLDLTGTAEQTDGFINLSLGGTIGAALTPMLMSLAPDVPINEGAIRAFDVIAPAGTIINPVEPAPTSAGHMETGSRLSKLVMRLLAELQAASSDPFVREHALAPFQECFAGSVFYAPNEDDELIPFLDMHGGGAGAGGHAHQDGMDCAGALTQLQNGLPDIEINELQFPVLYLWRRLNVASGGHGRSRGGHGLELAWTPWRTPGGQEHAFVSSSQVPPSGVFGGYPSGTCSIALVSGAGADTALREGHIPAALSELNASVTELPAKAFGLSVAPGDVVAVVEGGGGGFGDPLERDPKAVAGDVAAGYITNGTAWAAYGVLLGEDGGIDAAATADRRDALRAERRGAPAARSHTGAMPEGERVAVHPAIDRTGDVLACARCKRALGPATEDFREYLATRNSPAAQRLAELGTRIVAREGVTIAEGACPGCGTLLAVDVLVAEDALAAPRPHA